MDCSIYIYIYMALVNNQTIPKCNIKKITKTSQGLKCKIDEYSYCPIFADIKVRGRKLDDKYPSQDETEQRYLTLKII